MAFAGSSPRGATLVGETGKIEGGAAVVQVIVVVFVVACAPVRTVRARRPVAGPWNQDGSRRLGDGWRGMRGG